MSEMFPNHLQSTPRIRFSSDAAPSRKERRAGFALLIALGMMSFVLVLVLSMVLMASVETSNAANAKDRLLARENARLGLMIALGDLQKYAGPDQRVTARADILGDGNYGAGSKFWTGLWDPTSPGAANPIWLVSGESPLPLNPAGADSLRIFRATDNEAGVDVPVVEIQGADSISGEYAFWVADEGVKASATARRNAIPTYENAALNSQRSMTEYQAGFGVGLEPLFEQVELDLKDENFASMLARVHSANGFEAVVDSDGDPLVPISSISELSHSMTTTAFGVLENPLDGGLKKNLSDVNFRDSFLATDELQKFLGPKGGKLEADLTSGLPSRRSFAGKPYFSPRPLLTEVVLYVGLFHTWSDAKVRIRYHVEAEFVNPYSLPLQFPPDGDSRYTRAMILLIENLPTITVEDLAADSPAPTLTENLNALTAYSSNDRRRNLNSWFEINPTDTPNVPVLEPGEIYQVMEPNPATQERGLARDFGTQRWSGNQDTRPKDDARIRISAQHPSEGVTLTLVPNQGSADIASRPPIMKIEDIKFDDFEIEKVFRNGPSPFSRGTSSSYTILDFVFAYHFRIRSDDTDVTSMRDVLASVDLRDPDIDAAENFTDIEGNERSISDLFDPSETNPSFAIADDANLFSDLDQLYDATPRNHAAGDRTLVVHDIPDGDVLSIGQLSSLHLYRRQPRLIGSPWGEDFNEAFDRYYLSPKRINPVTTNPMLSSPALASMTEPAELADEDDAANELTVGSFNINSTSVKAWEAVLASPVLTPEAADENARGSADISRTASFFRLPQYQAAKSRIADERNDFFVTLDKLKEPVQAPNRSFAQGIRSLHADDGDLQTRQLAENIVEAIKNRGTPFADMKSFANSGILQNAIDDVGTGGEPVEAPAINENLMEFSNVYLTQNDILTKIAPQATTRSDTFKIRAYGAANNPLTGNANNGAWCEAVVQRLPVKLDGSDPLTPATADSPRRFQIINIRWLSDDSS